MSAEPGRQGEGTERSDPRFAVPTGLRATVVRYDGEPDRCTVYPSDADDAAITTHWLSADADCFVALDDAR